MDRSENNPSKTRVGVVLYDNFSVLQFAAVTEAFHAANNCSKNQLFNVQCLPITGGTAKTHSGTMVRASTHIGEQPDFDIVFVIGDGNSVLAPKQRLHDWLRLISKNGAKLVGISGGVVALSLAGLLNNRRCVIPARYVSALTSTNVRLKAVNQSYVFDNNIGTAINSDSAIQLILQLIGTLHGWDLSDQVKQYLLGYGDNLESGPVEYSNSVRETYGTTHPTIAHSISEMNANINHPLSLDQLSKKAGLSARQLNRLFNQQFGDSVMSHYKKIRLKQAAALLENPEANLTEIALMTGFASSSHFSHAFSKEYKTAPSLFHKVQL